MHDVQDAPGTVGLLASLVEGTGEIELRRLSKSVTFRLLLDQLALLDALAEASEHTRTLMVQFLLDAGWEALSGRLNKATLSKIRKRQADIAAALKEEAE